MKREAWWLAVAALGLTASASAGPAVWTSEGPYGGAVYRLFVNPTVPSVLYASTRGGIFRSIDSGVSWTRKEAGLSGDATYSYALGMDADASSTLWVTDSFGRVNRSTDGGDNWAQTGYTFASGTAINHLADVPGSVGKLLAATSAGVMVSSDSGASFLPSNSGLPSGVPIAWVAADPAAPLRMLAGTGYCCDIGTGDPAHPHSLYRSTDGGATWLGVYDTGTAGYYAIVSDISFGAGSTVYAVMDSQLYRSDNDGASWNGPLSASGVRQVQTVAADPVTSNTVLIGSWSGFSRSTDGGATSTLLNGGLTVAGSNIVTGARIALHPNYPTNQKVWLGTTDSGVYFADFGISSNWVPQNDGLAATNIRALAMFHDATTHRLFAGYGDPFRPSPALYRGNNSGPGTAFSSWATANTGLSALQIRSVTIDPTTKASGIGSTRLYATGRAGQSTFDSAVARNGGIYRSLDGGNTWSVIDLGVPTTGSPPAAFVGTVRNLVLDPRSCASPPSPPNPCTSGPLQTVYATSNGRTVTGTTQFRVMKSTNGGDSWANSDIGIPQPVTTATTSESLLVVPIVIDSANPQTLYVGASDFVANLVDGSPASSPPTLQSGVFKSTNGGANWTWSGSGLPLKTGSASTTYDVLSLAINPVNPQELWCSVIELSASVVVGGGIYHTTNGGASWSNASTGLTSADIRAIYVDPANPAVVYAAGGGTEGNPGGVYKSTNSGGSWTSISIGLPADAATALQVDPVDSTVLYAGTSSGVWSITQLPDSDGDGVPDSVENAAPNAGGLAAGDGNGDSILDSTQSKVGSLGSAGTGIAGADSPSIAQYFTVSVTPVTGTCSQVVDEQSVYAAYNGNDVSSYGDNYSYPRQLARFEITNCQKATVKVKFHGSTFAGGYSFRFFGPSTPGDPGTLGWYDFTSRATQTAPDTWQLTLDNGQFGSYRPGTANSILFEGGPGTHEGIFKNGFN
jgi:hypothetical protein